MMWPFVPNWRDGWKETLQFRTEIITSRSGKEQRRALRSTPRRTLEFRSVADGDRLRTLNGFMASQQDQTITLPEVTRAIRTTSALPVGGNSVTVEIVPTWLTAGVLVGLSHRRHQEQFVVLSVVGNVVQFTTVAQFSYGRVALLSPCVRGWLQDTLSAPLLTNTVSTPSVEFEVEPGSELPDDGEPDFTAWFNGREILMLQPNWSQAPNVTFSHAVETVDYGRGRVRRTSPVDFGTRTTQAAFVRRSRDETKRLRQFFQRMRGQQGEFYAPTWQNDMTPAVDAVEGSNTLIVSGRNTYDSYANDTVHRAVLIRLRDGTLLPRTVSSISLLEPNSVLVLVAPWVFDLPAADIVSITWLPVCRLASDTLVIEWETDQVARVSLQIRTLESFDSEYGDLMDPISEYMLSTYGLAFSENVIADPLQWAVNVRYPDIAEV